jgi:hypothetical protein
MDFQCSYRQNTFNINVNNLLMNVSSCFVQINDKRMTDCALLFFANRQSRSQDTAVFVESRSTRPELIPVAQ